MSEEAQERARALAEEKIERWVARGCPPPPAPAPDHLLEVMRFLAGDVGRDQLPLLYHQVGIREEMGELPPRPRVPEDFMVAVIGAGMSGLAAAYRLRRAAVPFVVFERNSDVGGVWLENTYPGVRLDTSNFCYSYSCAGRRLGGLLLTGLRGGELPDRDITQGGRSGCHPVQHGSAQGHL